MSNGDIIKGLYDAFAKGDVPVVLAAMDPMINWTEAEGFLYGGTYIGPDAILANVFMKFATEWEGFSTATRAAAAGGVTTLLDMPLNSIPPTTTLEAFKIKSKEAAGKCSVDYGFWGGVIPGNLSELEPMLGAGVWGFKAFMCDSGVEEFPLSPENVLHDAMKVLARCKAPLLVHAEVEQASAPSIVKDPRDYQSYLDSRPAGWEVAAVRLIIRLARNTGCSVHIVHLSAAEAIKDIVEAKSSGVAVSVETCPHYLTLHAEEIPTGATAFKCAPPIREKANQDQLWEGLKSGQIDFIVSDHSPCTPKLKQLESGDFGKAWGGIAGLQFSLPLVWTAMRQRGLPLQLLTRWMSIETSRRVGLAGYKGSLTVGKDADFVVWNPESSFVVRPEQVLHRHSVTPYSGKTLYGVIDNTFVRGISVYDKGQFQPSPMGQELRRKK